MRESGCVRCTSANPLPAPLNDRHTSIGCDNERHFPPPRNAHPMPCRTRLALALSRISLVCLLLPANIALAHPHVWIKYAAIVKTDGTSIVAIEEHWRFTEGFPVQLVGVDQLPANGPLDAAQTKRFHDQAFVSLAHSGYFTHLFVDGDPKTVGEPTGFKVSVEGGKIVYSFRLPLVSPVDVRGKKVVLGIWDPSYYVDYEPEADSPVSFGPGSPHNCSTRSFVDKMHPIFNGFVLPSASEITC